MLDERRLLVAEVLRRAGRDDARGLRVFEAGCSSGYNLREFVQLGADPRDLAGIDISAEKVEAGRLIAPLLRLHAGDAQVVPEPDASFDIGLAFTLFSSVPGEAASAAIAAELMRVVRPDGLILVYDMRRPSPSNSSVHRIRRSDSDRWFPGCRRRTYTLTVAPPLARRLPALYGIFRLAPILRTHEFHVLRLPR